MTVYYNEHDKHAAAWLRSLIDAGHIAPGVVDERDIRDILPSELAGFTQCHFFAGIGVWSYALRLAGWPDDRPVWTGSCPCQPFSAAGKGAGFDDERHLWPAWHHLIKERRPVRIFGEQVASSDGLVWLDLVHADMEASKYAFGAVDLCAAGVGAPHIRQRLWFVADADGRHAGSERQQRSRQHGQQPENRGAGGAVDDADDAGLEGRIGSSGGGDKCVAGPAGVAGALADDNKSGRRAEPGLRLRGADFHDADGRGPVSGFWRSADWISCRDDKWRPVEPGTFPLAAGAPARVVRLRGYGNAINAQAARVFIEACQ